MTDSSAQPDKYGQVVVDGQGTVGLVRDVAQLLGQPVRYFFSKRSKARELKQSMGQWDAEAYDMWKQLMIPILKLKEFEDHLVKEDGWFKPTGTNTADGYWAYLLHALGIRPGMKALKWKPPPRGALAEKGGMIMEMEGAVLCHIINLFRTEPSWFNMNLQVFLSSCGDVGECCLPFGDLSWNTTNGGVHACFTPGDKDELDSPRAPLGRVGQMLDPNTLTGAYYNALRFGASRSDLAWPDLKPSSASTKERMKALLAHMDVVKWTPNPLLLTYEWLENASRIKRRILTRGGQDRKFLDDINEFIQRSSIIEEAEKMRLRQATEEKFMFEDQKFVYVVGPTPNHSGLRSSTLPSEILHEVLDTYKNEPNETWKHDLYTMADLVEQVLFLPHAVQLRENIRVLDLRPSDPLWNQRVLFIDPVRRLR